MITTAVMSRGSLWCRYNCVLWRITAARKLCNDTSVSTVSSPAETIEELKAIDPLTGEKRIGNNFVYAMELRALASRLGYSEEQLPSLQLALIHHSVFRHAKTKEVSPLHNSRLTAVGESRLAQYIHQYLYHTYPNIEGYMMWDIKNHLMDWSALDKMSKYLGVANLMITKDSPNDQMFGRALLAVFGAVCLDQGPASACKMAHQFILPQLKDADLKDIIKIHYPVYLLALLCQAQKRPRPVPRLLKETGRLTHFPTFVVGVYSGEELLGEGAGTSLKRARSEAASTALRKHFLAQIENSRNYRAESEWEEVMIHKSEAASA